MAFVPRKRMGPPPRSFAADAHDCIMVRVFGPTEYKVVARLIRAPERGLPSDRHPQKVGKITTRNRLTIKTPYKVWRSQRLGGHFWRHCPIPSGRDHAIPRLRRQSRGKSKTIPTAPGIR